MVSSSGRMPVERVGFVALIFAAVLYLSGGSGGTGGYASARQLDEVQLSLSGTNGAPFPGHILVIGGAGFIGSHVAERLASRHPEYTVRARFRPRVRASNNARTLHPSLARTTDRERLVALDRLSSWTSSTIARA